MHKSCYICEMEKRGGLDVKTWMLKDNLSLAAIILAA